MSEVAQTERIDPFGDPWDQRPGESDHEYALFLRYRNLGRSRSLDELADLLATGKTELRRLAQRKRWNRRCRAWDVHRRRVWIAEQEEGRERAGRLAGNLGELMMSKAGNAAMQADPAELEAKDVASWSTSGARAAEYGWGSAADRPDDADQDADPLGLAGLPHASELTPDERAEQRRRALDLLAGAATRTALDPHRSPAERLRATQAAVQAYARTPADDTDESAEDVRALVAETGQDIADVIGELDPDARNQVIAALRARQEGAES